MRTGHWGLTVPYFCALTEDKNAAFSAVLGDPGMGGSFAGNEESLSSIRGDKEGRPDWHRVYPYFAHYLAGNADRPLGVNGSLLLVNNRG